jgi:hypothetical protein
VRWAIHAVARPSIDFAIAFVRTPGVPRSALNFTSHTFNQMRFGGPDQLGLQQILNRFNQSGNTLQLDTDLSRLSHRAPYRHLNLLPIWIASINTVATTGATQSVTDAGPFHGNNAIVANQLRADLVDYLDYGVGDTFNVLLGHDRHGSDFDLTYNGRVSRV